MACQTTFMALGQARTSLFLALLRKVILLVPLALILPRVTGSVFGIYAAEPHRRHLGQCHHIDPVPHPAEETAAGGGSLLKSCRKSAKLKSLE